LFWSIPEDKKEKISEAVLVEYILNYGNLDDCRALIRLMGVKQTIFHIMHMEILSPAQNELLTLVNFKKASVCPNY
jgi:hypothetical protein